MFGQKARQSKPVQSNESTSHRSSKLFCYLDKSNSNNYFLYWKAEASTLGVTDLGANLFEAMLDRKERKKLLKNVAESLVEAKWKSTFMNKGLKLGSISDEAMEIRYISECVQLPRIEDAEVRQARNVELLKNALEEINELSDLLKGNTSSNASKSTSSSSSSQQAGKRHHESPAVVPLADKEQSLMEKNRRKRGKATGLVFQDDEEEE
uniref:Uncharacterized protein n=1 Tax=Ditylenchus dipsaci TaxID=166011 RepID=A0A915CN29_9BILA